MRNACILSLIFLLVATSGCRWFCCGKRASELECPTDIRQTQCWCMGEDAIFHCPCGPDSEFYGYQPTCWRNWPAAGAEWRDMHCPPPPSQFVPHAADATHQPGSQKNAPAEHPTLPNPFRDDRPALSPDQAGEFIGGS
ncbi:MAG: hypothetical protein WD669_09965 [Pirellulales bacterium]